MIPSCWILPVSCTQWKPPYHPEDILVICTALSRSIIVDFIVGFTSLKTCRKRTENIVKYVNKGIGSSVYRGLGWKEEGSWFKHWQNMGVILVAGGATTTQSKLCQGTLEQGSNPPNAHISPGCHSGVSSPRCSWDGHPPCEPNRDKAVKKRKGNKWCLNEKQMLNCLSNTFCWSKFNRFHKENM